MITYSPEVSQFVDCVMLVVKQHEYLTNAEVTGGLRILASALEAMANNARIEVHIVTIQEEKACDSEESDPADYWKTE